jgi:ferritin-like metal-binding protein YciE
MLACILSNTTASLNLKYIKGNKMNKVTSTPKKNSKSVNGISTAAGKGQHDSMLMNFFKDELKDIYWAEKHLVKTLPKMAKAATSKELKSAFTGHLQVTTTHVSRLEEVFGILGEKARAKKCEAMEGITKEGEGIIKDTEAGTNTRDVGLILAAQKVEHYEISTYGGLAQLATTLGLEEVAGILHSTLEEEKEADSSLTAIAENDINYEAAEEEA